MNDDRAISGTAPDDDLDTLAIAEAFDLPPAAVRWPEDFDPDPKTNPNVRGEVMEIEIGWDTGIEAPEVECLVEADPFHDADEPPPLTDAEADALIDRLASLDERERRIKSQAEAMCKEVARQRQGILFKHALALQQWTARKLRGKARSVKRLVGTAGFRTVPGRMIVSKLDAERALAWAKTNLPEAVVETLDLKAIKPVEDYHPDTGELCYRSPAPCFQWNPERDTFYVRGAKDATEGDYSDE